MLLPLTWLRDQIQAVRPAGVGRSRALTAAIVSAADVLAERRQYAPGGVAGRQPCDLRRYRPSSSRSWGSIAADLPVVDTRLWGGLLVTLVVSVTGIVASMPVGIALALGRRSTIPLIRIFLDRLHRVLARGSADHGAVLRNLYAAAVRADRLHHRRADARADRHRAVCGCLPGRSHPRRPAGDPARAGRGGERARPVLGARPRR